MAPQNLHAFLESWIAAWNGHDLDGVLSAMADDVVFEHWTGATLRGKRQLQLAWGPWFANHGEFRFDVKSVCVSDTNDSFSFEWSLDWPSPDRDHAGQREVREGIDYVRMRGGLVVSKHSYVKTASSARPGGSR